MKKPLRDIEKNVNDRLQAELSVEDKAWDIIFEFYHQILTKMEKHNISQADLARKLGKSRSAVSQLLNKTPNISIRRMVEIADAVGLEFTLTPVKHKRVHSLRSPYLQDQTQTITPRMEVNEE